MLRCGCVHCGQPCLPNTSADQVQESAADVERADGPWSNHTSEQLAVVIKAYRAKDRLLGFDAQHTRRTQVLDAQEDYYETSTWLNPEEKAKIDALQSKRRAARVPSARRYKMTVDIAGRKAYTQDAEADQVEQEQEDLDQLHELRENARSLQEKEEASLELEMKMQNMPPQSDDAIEENVSLHYNQRKAGQVYRLLKEGLAPWRDQDSSGTGKGKGKGKGKEGKQVF